jgi:hypothetical protein
MGCDWFVSISSRPSGACFARALALARARVRESRTTYEMELI